MERASRGSGKLLFINRFGVVWSQSPRVALASLAQGFISGGCCASSLAFLENGVHLAWVWGLEQL